MKNPLSKSGTRDTMAQNQPKNIVKDLMNGLVKSALVFLIAFSLASCQKGLEQADGNTETGTNQKNVAKTKATLYDIACTSSSSNKIEVYPPGDTGGANWGTPIWSWKPNTTDGYTSTEIGYWENGSSSTAGVGDPFEVKLRNNSKWSATSTQVIATVGGRLATILAYPSGQKLWARDLGTSVWPHSAELLPNGNLATASSTGNLVRLYNTTSGATNYASAALTTAHGVLWDPVNYILWAIGDATITAYTTGTRTAPALDLITARTANLPTTGGHDIAPYYGDNNKLWVTTSSGVYIYNKTSKTFTASPGTSFKTKVKSVGNQHASALGYPQIVTTREVGTCSFNSWCTDTVKFYNLNTGTLDYKIAKPGGAFYKARVFSPEYQDAPSMPFADGDYVITNRNSGLALAVQSAGVANSDPIVQYAYTAAAPTNDVWTLTQLANGYYRITNKNSGKALHVPSAGTEKKDILVQYTYSTGAPYNDEWAIVSVGSGYYKIISRNSNLIVNVKDGVTTSGATIWQWTYSTGNAGTSEWAFSAP